MKRISPWRTMDALLLDIAAAQALAAVDTDPDGAAFWTARATELRAKAGTISPVDEALIASRTQAKIEAYS